MYVARGRKWDSRQGSHLDSAYTHWNCHDPSWTLLLRVH